MSKAVLVIDMPERCADCQLSCPLRNSSHAKNSYACCYLTLKDISKTDYYDKKPDWCPLRELPEKNPNNPELGNQAGISQPGVYYTEKGYEVYKRGWNACLDEILK